MDVSRKEKLKAMIAAGVHFGHQKSRWCPKMKHYIWGHRANVHLINIDKTLLQVEKAISFLTEKCDKTILWVGTKKSAKEAILHVANDLGNPHVTNRWIGGSLTNWDQVKKSLAKLAHYKEIIAKHQEEAAARGVQSIRFTKKEINVMEKKIQLLERNIGGIKNLKQPVAAVVIVDIKKERSALKEAVTMGIPVIGIADTNSDPTGVAIVIPANDDSPKSVNLVLSYLHESIAQAKKILAEKRKAEKKAKEAAAAEAMKKAQEKKKATIQNVAAEKEETVAKEKTTQKKTETVTARKKTVAVKEEESKNKKTVPTAKKTAVKKKSIAKKEESTPAAAKTVKKTATKTKKETATKKK